MSMLPVLIVLWSFCIAICVALTIYRGHLTRHEVDQVFLNDAVEHDREIEHDGIVRRVEQVDPFLKTAGGAAALITVAIVTIYIVDIYPTVHF